MKTLRDKIKDFIFTIEDRDQEANVNEVLSIVAMEIHTLRVDKENCTRENHGEIYNSGIDDAIGLLIGKK